ncbi:MAG: hypothetical protein ACTTKH_05415 [Treponema sp.]
MQKLGSKFLNLWDEPFMQKKEMKDSAKLLYIYLLSNALSNIAGIYKITDRRIEFDLGSLDLTDAFSVLKKLKKVYRFGEWVVIKDAPLQIKKKNKTSIKEMDEIIFSLPDRLKEKLKKIHYNYAHLYGEPLQCELLGITKKIEKELENIEKQEGIKNEAFLFEIENNGNVENNKRAGCANKAITPKIEEHIEAKTEEAKEEKLEAPIETKTTTKPEESKEEKLEVEAPSFKDYTSDNVQGGLPDVDEFARSARVFAIKESRLEQIEKMRCMKKASEITPYKKTVAPNPVASKNDVLQKESCKNEMPNPEAPKNDTPKILPKQKDLAKENEPKKDIVKDDDIAKIKEPKNELIENAKANSEMQHDEELFDAILENEKLDKDVPWQLYTEKAPYEFGDAYEEVEYPLTKEEILAKEEKRKKEILQFQAGYAKDVYKQFQNAGLYVVIAFNYFLKADFEKGIQLLKANAITVEDNREAYSLNQIIKNYLLVAQLQNKGLTWWKSPMAFYRMCEPATYDAFTPSKFDISKFIKKDVTPQEKSLVVSLAGTLNGEC